MRFKESSLIFTMSETVNGINVHKKNIALRIRAIPALFPSIILLCACSGGGGGSAPSPVTGAVGPVTLAAASVQRTLEVPPVLAQTPPFNEARSLAVPPGFGIRVWAQVNKARFLARAPNGDILVSVPSENKIVLLRERPNDVPESFDFVTGLRRPHDMVFHEIGGITYLYVAETNRVTRSVYTPGATTIGALQVVVDNLPDSSLPELQGQYAHELKNIALGPDSKLYVSIASNCNACEEDTLTDPVRGAIYQYNADGTGGRLFARGLRNAEGLDFIPGTNALWVAVNNRDEVVFPRDEDVTGDGVSDLGTIVPQYVDDIPSEPFTLVRDGGNYGWPFCNAVPNPTMSNLENVPDYETNRDGSKLNCAAIDRSSKGIQAHSAPLGLSFLHNSNVPAAYRSGAAIALHGCWNCTTLKGGYKVVYFPFDAAGNPGAEIDLVAGFVTDPVARQYWGRPVDAIADGRGSILISDDYANALYQLYPLAQ